MRQLMFASCLVIAALSACASMDNGSKSTVEAALANPARSAGYDGFGKKGWTERLANGRLPNVRHVVGPTTALGMDDATLDGAVIVMSYHDLYWVEEKEGWSKIDASQFLDQVVAALTPGGVLLEVDHSAMEGTGPQAEVKPLGMRHVFIAMVLL